ncbi:MAG: DUF1080 domain-containing protein, partial [Cyclobacteriaceae bacterium]
MKKYAAFAQLGTGNWFVPFVTLLSFIFLAAQPEPANTSLRCTQTRYPRPDASLTSSGHRGVRTLVRREVKQNSTAVRIIDKDNGGWETLFDGTNLNKWRRSTSDASPSEGWVIEGDALVVKDGRKGGDIITRNRYANFDLRLEFRFSELANSGIKYLVTEIQDSKSRATSLMGMEYQIIDDFNHSAVKATPNSNISTGSVYLLYPTKGKKLLPIGQWNQARIIVKGKHIEHWLNGKRIASYQSNSKDFHDRVAQTKFKDYPDYGLADNGHILLQDHGGEVAFRNIL